MTSVSSDREVAEAVQRPVGRYRVAGGRVVEWEIDNAADERPDGTYTLFSPLKKACEMNEFEKAARLMNETGQGEHLGVSVAGAVRRPVDEEPSVAAMPATGKAQKAPPPCSARLGLFALNAEKQRTALALPSEMSDWPDDAYDTYWKAKRYSDENDPPPEKARASSGCPVCEMTTPHQHTLEDLRKLRRKVAFLESKLGVAPE